MSLLPQFRQRMALSIATFSSLIFWASAVLFAIDEIAFERAPLPTPWWVEPVAGILVFIFWASAFLATAACLWAYVSQRLPLTRARHRLAESDLTERNHGQRR